ncbi:MAG: glycoside hydrolase family 2 [Clostridia bacterium]|nr:glycoside hydrolase family 2 [Clostridia bacterium]
MSANIPFPEYPRPQLARDSYFNLNGAWRLFVAGERGEEQEYTITVPFSPEARLSGVEMPPLTPTQTLRYERTFTLPQNFIRTHTLLHFGAVDAFATVYLNGVKVGSHAGGFTPFTCNVTGALSQGENRLTVEVTDPTECGEQGRGKQLLAAKGIWYTAQSGIWQTVWMESLPAAYIEDLTILPNFDEQTVTLTVQTQAKTLSATVFNGETALSTACAEGDGSSLTLTLPVPHFIPWSPENPHLYGLTLTAGEDVVTSYFGMRKFSVESGSPHAKSNTNRRFFLNNRPYFLSGVLDQGYYDGGLLTPPNEQTVVNDILMLKRMGFNMLRKHIKVEPARFYYLCDKLGILVVQDFVNGGKPYRFTTIALKPFLHIYYKDGDYARFGRENEEGRAQFNREAEETFHALKNVISLCIWCPFNEGWGQFDAKKAYDRLKEIDKTRPVDSTSGWHDQGDESSDFYSIHNYFTKLKVPKMRRAVFLSEFGGYSMPVKGHQFNEKKGFGYRVYKTQARLEKALTTLYEKRLLPLLKKGLCGCVYTQLSDVENEINGLVTYDRKIVKVSEPLMARLNGLLTQENQ